MLFKISKKHHYFRFLAEQFFFKLLLFLNGLSYKYQIGLKLKLIYNSFKKYKQDNFSLMVYHIGHKRNWFLNKNFDQELIHSSQIDLKYSRCRLDLEFILGRQININDWYLDHTVIKGCFIDDRCSLLWKYISMFFR